MSDLVTFGETMLRLSPPNAERLETTRTLDVRAAGSESNVAVAASRLGVDATWISKLPHSPLGRRVVSELHQYGIRTAVAWSNAGRQGTYYLEQAGDPRGTKVFYDREHSAITTATPDEIDTDLIESARLFFTSGITPALSSTLRETVTQLLEIAAEAETTTALDLNYRRSLWDPTDAADVLTGLFPLIDVLIIKTDDARTVLDYEGDGPQLAHALASNYDFTTVVVTQGEKGATAWHDSVVHELEAFETDTVDPIGTGDAFTGAFLARRLSGDDIGVALDYAGATAALKRTIPGDVATVTKEEVESVIAGTDDGIDR